MPDTTPDWMSGGSRPFSSPSHRRSPCDSVCLARQALRCGQLPRPRHAPQQGGGHGLARPGAVGLLMHPRTLQKIEPDEQLSGSNAGQTDLYINAQSAIEYFGMRTTVQLGVHPFPIRLASRSHRFLHKVEIHQVRHTGKRSACRRSDLAHRSRIGHPHLRLKLPKGGRRKGFIQNLRRRKGNRQQLDTRINTLSAHLRSIESST